MFAAVLMVVDPCLSALRLCLLASGGIDKRGILPCLLCTADAFLVFSPYCIELWPSLLKNAPIL